MAQAQFYYKDKNAPQPRGNRIGTCILLEYDGKLLLEHRTDSDLWAVIGGGLKTDERMTEGVIREAFEETGIRLKADEIELYNIYDEPSRIASYPDGNVWRIITVAYRVKLSEQPEVICSEESRELRFFRKAELGKVKIAATHVPVLEDYLKESNGCSCLYEKEVVY